MKRGGRTSQCAQVWPLSLRPNQTRESLQLALPKAISRPHISYGIRFQLHDLGKE